MSGLDNLNLRLRWNGGNQEGRMQSDKLKSLKKALLYSYQAATAILQNGQEFRCLINPDKNKLDYEDKIISIPYRDICLNADKVGKTSEGEVDIDIKPGDVFTWKETNTYWLVYLQRLEEDSYFRAEIRQCEHEVDINGKKYKCYLKGPDQTSILWHTRRGFGSWNDLNYDAVMYVTSNEETRDFFHRFTKVTVDGKPWEVHIVDGLTTEGILQICIKEWFTNTIEDEVAIENENKKPEPIEVPDLDWYQGEPPHIIGDTIVYPYDNKIYSIEGIEDGHWEVNNSSAIITAQNDKKVALSITTSRKGSFKLIYKSTEDDVVLPITIESL